MSHRILFYSHDSFGLGHFRRSLTIASFLTRHIDDLSILMVTGIESPTNFEKPRRLDFVKLPAVWKSGPDEYRSRHLRVSFNRVRRIREQLIHGVVRAFEPEMLIVDNVPRGLDGELLPTLRFLRAKRPRTRIVLTLRDVLDAPEHIVPQWRQGVFKHLERLYDEIWVAGCRSVFDPIELYQFPAAVATKVKFCGYVVRSDSTEEAEDIKREFKLGDRRLIVASCGGGGDGYPLISTFVDAAKPLTNEGLLGAIFLGPDMPAAERRALKQKLLPLSDRFLTFDFRPDLVSFLRLASASVSMGGYNTMAELVELRVPAVVVPRAYPRVEQLLRAEAFARLGLMRVLHPEHLDVGPMRTALQDLLDHPPAALQAPLPDGFDFAGRRRMVRRVRRTLGLVEKR